MCRAGICLWLLFKIAKRALARFACSETSLPVAGNNDVYRWLNQNLPEWKQFFYRIDRK